MENRYQDSFNTPFSASTDAEAIYQVRLIINQSREPRLIPEDWALHRVGEFDTENCIFRNDHEILIADCSTLRFKKEGGDNE